MRVVAYPRNTDNPYQRLLDGELRRLGVEVAYLGETTPSQTLNLALLPAALAYHRCRGARVLHLHWVYLFAPFWAGRVPFGRRVMQAWFAFFLQVAGALGYRLVWTAHNLLPHQQVFADDPAARALLARRAEVVIAHGSAVVEPLRALGAREVRVVPAGSYLGRYPQGLPRAEARRRLGLDADRKVALFVGAVAPYKGVDLLLQAAAELAGDGPAVVVAGSCKDPDERARLTALARAAGPGVLARFEHVPDEELQCYFASADVAVLPYRRVTNSSSVLLAYSFGVPALVPDLPELADLPDRATLRYPPGEGGLVKALAALVELEPEVLAARARAARAYAGSLSWEEAARHTRAAYAGP